MSHADELQEDALFPIVGIGASAGGLEAFTQLLKALPPDTGAAFVLVQHLSPSHPSMLSEILGRATEMPVIEVNDEPIVEADHVYVIPPGRCMDIVDGHLHLEPRARSDGERVVDHFFRALADKREHLAIAVVLSGTGTDGTQGLEAIKAKGGITFAQDDSAAHNGMPHSAIDSGCVDYVLPPDQIAGELARIAKRPTGPLESDTADARAALQPVVAILQQATGVDFSDYKFNTFQRRVNRRMAMAKIDSLVEYATLLRKTPDEVEALHQDVLIGVTGFFRNPDAFETLASKVLPRLFNSRSPDDPVRTWVVGCSTGQEAYSLAMAYTEVAQAHNANAALQLFGTDLNPSAVDTARAGVYSKEQLEDVSAERLERFFVKVDGHYRIAKKIRDLCVFSRHNVLSDPPFSRMDLISCRNLLIYLEPALQRQVLPILHYALKPDGTLFLGGSESIGGFRTLFEAEDGRRKVYRRKGGAAALVQPRASLAAVPRPAFTPLATRPPNGQAELAREADRHLLTRFAPPGVLVNAELDILQFRGDTSAFLLPAPGKASLNLLKMLREGLRVSIRAAIQRASEQTGSVRETNLRVKSRSGTFDCAVEVIPIRHAGSQERGFLILFEETGADATAPAVPAAPLPPATDDDYARLTQELVDTREYLQSVIERHEAANDELQSANEEIQSANEELQSSNEELETSKEEIQSANEELVTVNDELNSRNLELNRLNNDLVNLLDGVQMPIVMLSRDLRVRRFTPAASSVLNLIPADIGRPLADIRLNVDGLDDPEPLLREVLDTVSVREREVQARNGRWYSLRLRPYKTLDHQIDGVLLLMVDVDALKRAGQYAEEIVATVREPMLVLDAALRVQTASRRFCEYFQVAPAETENRHLSELGNGQWNLPALLQALQQVLLTETPFNDFKVEHEFEHLGRRTMLLNARALPRPHEGGSWLLLAIEDITERQRTADRLRQYANDLEEADRRKNEFLALLAHELRNPLAPISNALQLMKRGAGSDGDADTRVRDRRHTPLLGMMERQVGLMVRLVEDLLDVSRITQGKMELRKRSVELSSVVEQAMETARPLCELRTHQLTVAMPQQSIRLYADAARLVQVIGNLLSNACKFTRAGGNVRLEVTREDQEVVFRIRDNGIGIAADQLSRIFDVFVQVESPSDGIARGGLGIGLMLVRRVVELHGGTVQAFSAGLGQGSEFVVRLPILPDVSDLSADAADVDMLAAKASLRILVVDDNRDSSETLGMLLQASGHETRLANDGVEAIAVAEAFRPDIVLLDLGMPTLDGYATAREIRKTAWGKNLKLIALSGWGQDEARQKSRDAGFDDHLVKPLSPAALAMLLNKPPGR